MKRSKTRQRLKQTSNRCRQKQHQGEQSPRTPEVGSGRSVDGIRRALYCASSVVFPKDAKLLLLHADMERTPAERSLGDPPAATAPAGPCAALPVAVHAEMKKRDRAAPAGKGFEMVVSGVTVKFPFLPPYRSQLALMHNVIKVALEGKNALIEVRRTTQHSLVADHRRSACAPRRRRRSLFD
jgi:hypothetical protein